MKTSNSYYKSFDSIYFSVNSWVTHYYELAFPIHFPYLSKPNIKELPLCVCAPTCVCVLLHHLLHSTWL